MQGTRLDRYEIIRLLGKGGMGKVYLASDREGGREVALKVLAVPRSVATQALARFRREARAQSMIENPHVVGIYDYDFDHDPPYLAMEFVEGQDLQSHLEWSGSLEVDRVLRIARDLAEALDCMHAQGVLHRDLKPSNVMLRKADDSAVLMDLGLARVQDATALTGTGQIVGTPMYLPPEALHEVGWQESSDIYQLGAVLFELLTGKTLIPGRTMEDILHGLMAGERRPFPPEREIPEVVQAALMRAVDVSPAARFHSGADLVAALSGRSVAPAPPPVPDQGLPAPHLASPPREGTPTPGKGRWVLGVVAAVGVAVGASLGLEEAGPREVRWKVVGDAVQVDFLPGRATGYRLEVGDRVARPGGREGERVEIRYQGLPPGQAVPARLVWTGGEGPRIQLEAQAPAVDPRFRLRSGRRVELRLERPARVFLQGREPGDEGGSSGNVLVEAPPQGNPLPPLVWEEQGQRFLRPWSWSHLHRQAVDQVRTLPGAADHSELVRAILERKAPSPLLPAEAGWKELLPWLPEIFSSSHLGREGRVQVWNRWQVFQLYQHYDRLVRRNREPLWLPPASPGSRFDALLPDQGLASVSPLASRFRGKLLLAPPRGARSFSVKRLAATAAVDFDWPRVPGSTANVLVALEVDGWRIRSSVRIRSKDRPPGEGFEVLIYDSRPGKGLGYRHDGWLGMVVPRDLLWEPGSAMVLEVVPQLETDKNEFKMLAFQVLWAQDGG